MSRTAAIQKSVNEVREALLSAVADEHPLVVVKAPPGSGKTRLITDAAAFVRSHDGRVAIAAQTNSQANDICRRLATDFPFEVTRFYASSAAQEDLGSGVVWVTDKDDLPLDACIVVATSAKWGLIDLADEFDWLLVDEAWQMAEADFMLLRQVAPRFVMVGDPGQIPPVVTIDTARWVTAEIPPHRPAPELIVEAEGDLPLVELALPATRRLPHDSAEAVNTFYDFDFESWAGPGDRSLECKPNGGDPIDAAIDKLREASIVGLTLPTPPEGPPLEEDREVAELASAVATRLVTRGGKLNIDGSRRKLRADDIGMTATHRRMNARMAEALPPELGRAIAVDTPERWQGLERPVMVVVHPVSGVTDPTAFDLETGRLCVMASRHQVGLIVVTRDHLPSTLENLSAAAEQHVGLPDIVGQGQARHEGFWNRIRGTDAVVAAGA